MILLIQRVDDQAIAQLKSLSKKSEVGLIFCSEPVSHFNFILLSRLLCVFQHLQGRRLCLSLPEIESETGTETGGQNKANVDLPLTFWCQH